MHTLSIHFFKITSYPALSVAEGLEPILAIIGRKEDTFWTNQQFITEVTYRDKVTVAYTPVDNLELPINPICMSSNSGTKLDYPDLTNAGISRAYKLHKERPE